ncbi:hypothetical protein ACI6Q2_16000 [Chitinophagaceae bacterium LWZ2-11]
MNQRIPAFSLVGINSDCINQINQKLQEFKQQDLNQQRLLTNQYNSHREGWVEKVPGTCNAGGPPPICPVDHWIRDPQAMSKWDADQRKVKAAREGELYGISNNCQIAYQKQQQELAEKNKEKQEADRLKQEQASKDAAAKRQADANARMDEWRRKQQEANQRVANTIDSLRQAQAMQQAKIAAAGDQLQNDMAANNQNAQDAVNNYKQSSELNTDNTDSKNQARAILNASGSDQMSSSIFAPTTDPSLTGNDATSFARSNINDMVNDYGQSGAASNNHGMVSFAGKLLDMVIPSAGASDDIPTGGYKDAAQQNVAQYSSPAINTAKALPPSEPAYSESALYHPYIIGQGNNATNTLNSALDGNDNAIEQFRSNYAKGTKSFLQTITGTGLGYGAIVILAPVEVPGAIAVAGGYVIYKIAEPAVNKLIDRFFP